MKKFRKHLFIVLLAMVLLAILGILALKSAAFGFARPVSDTEKQKRLQIVATAEEWLGAAEADGGHKPIIDLYNAHEPLAVGYLMKYEDAWCATFGSTVAIQCGMTGIIPTECGCQRQIKLFESLGCWVEDDNYIPLPGDYIFYSSKDVIGDNIGWSDHVGIVVGTWGNYIKVIEGNYLDRVEYRIIAVGDSYIRGYGVPNYG
jgi:hypothetical protein